MRRRLRKKRRLGEFREYGFAVRFSTPNLSVEQGIDFLDRWIEDAIETNGLVCGGGGKSPNWEFFVTRDRRGSATNAHQQSLRQWLQQQAQVGDFQIGRLVDANHGSDEDWWKDESSLVDRGK